MSCDKNISDYILDIVDIIYKISGFKYTKIVWVMMISGCWLCIGVSTSCALLKLFIIKHDFYKEMLF